MRTKHRLFTMGGLLAGAVALGCQAPAVAPQGVGAPRAVVHVGAVKLEPDADMAIVLNRTDCGEKAFALKQVQPDPRVAYIKVEVTGPGLVEPYKKTITRDAFGGLCDTTLNLSGLATGTYTVRFTSYNLTDDPVAFATSPVNVINGTTSELNLVCNFDLGKLDVNIHCCDDGASPTPLPTATPVPTPTPTPAAAVLTSQQIGGTTGFAVDPSGDVYVFGFDQGIDVPGQRPGTRDQGRIVKVSGTSVFEAWQTDVTPMVEAEIRNGKLEGMGITYTGGGQRTDYFSIPLSAPSAMKRFGLFIQAQSPYAANTTDEAGNFYIESGSSGTIDGFDIYKGSIAAAAGVSGSIDRGTSIYKYPTTSGEFFRPLSMSYDAVAGEAVWSSERGICRKNPTTGLAPLVDVDLAGADLAYGMIMVPPSPIAGAAAPQEYLFTQFSRPDDRSIYHATVGADAQSLEVPFTFDHGLPYRIEKASDTDIYVMLAEDGQGLSGRDFAMIGGFRIVRMTYDPVSRKLTPLYVVVDKYTDQSIKNWH